MTYLLAESQRNASNSQMSTKPLLSIDVSANLSLLKL